jgi:hypothetical protein
MARGWLSASKQTAATLPEFLRLSGEDGWELISHAVNQDLRTRLKSILAAFL